MEFKLFKELYTNDLSPKKVKRYRSRLEQGKPALSLYLIALPLTGQGILEIYPYTSLLQKHYKESSQSMYVLGMADSYDDALELTRQMIENMYKKTGGFSVRDFVKLASDVV